jgi:hypothetical protein
LSYGEGITLPTEDEIKEATAPVPVTYMLHHERKLQFEHILEIWRKFKDEVTWVHVHDDDDLSSPERFESFLKTMVDKPEIRAYFCEGSMVSEWDLNIIIKTWDEFQKSRDIDTIRTTDFGCSSYRIDLVNEILTCPEFGEAMKGRTAGVVDCLWRIYPRDKETFCAKFEKVHYMLRKNYAIKRQYNRD